MTNLQNRPFGRRLKVLHIGKFYPPHNGGMESHLKSLCEQLRESVDVEVLVANDHFSTEHEVVKGVPVCRAGTWLTLASTSFCPSMAARIRQAGADLVHVHWPNPSAVLAYFSSGAHGRLICAYHSDVARQKLLRISFGPILQAFLRRCSSIIVSSPNYLATSPVLETHRDRCHLIPFGIPVDEFAKCDVEAVGRLRQRYGNRLVLGVGRLVYYKGFQYLIQAMASVQGRLLLVGTGPLLQSLKCLASEVGVSNKVAFLGEVPDHELRACYHAADVFVLPSVVRTEAFGIVQIEAMAAGKPVVNTSLDSGVPFVSRHERTGLTVPPANATALASAISRLLDDAELRRSFGVAARIRAQSEFGLQKMVSRTLQLYAATMENGYGKSSAIHTRSNGLAAAASR